MDVDVKYSWCRQVDHSWRKSEMTAQFISNWGKRVTLSPNVQERQLQYRMSSLDPPMRGKDAFILKYVALCIPVHFCVKYNSCSWCIERFYIYIFIHIKRHLQAVTRTFKTRRKRKLDPSDMKGFIYLQCENDLPDYSL